MQWESRARNDLSVKGQVFRNVPELAVVEGQESIPYSLPTQYIMAEPNQISCERDFLQHEDDLKWGGSGFML